MLLVEIHVMQLSVTKICMVEWVEQWTQNAEVLN